MILTLTASEYLHFHKSFAKFIQRCVIVIEFRVFLAGVHVSSALGAYSGTSQCTEPVLILGTTLIFSRKTYRLDGGHAGVT